MLRGPAGTGKTEGAKAIAAGLHLPYRCITCSANTEIFDLLGQILPDVDEKQLSLVGELPSFQDITLDPATAYEKLTGTYDEKVSENFGEAKQGRMQGETGPDADTGITGKDPLRRKAAKNAAESLFPYLRVTFLYCSIQSLKRGF